MESINEFEKRIERMTESEKIERDLYLKDILLGKVNGPLTGYPALDKPWLKYHSDDAIKGSIPKVNLYEYLLEQNKDNMEDVALVYGPREITYRELFENIDSVANNLVAMGINKNDAFTSCLPNMPEAVYLIYAAAKIGAVADLIDPLTNSELLAKYCNISESKIFFTMDILKDKAIDLVDKGVYEKAILVSPLESLNMSENVKYENKNILNWKDFTNTKTDKKVECCKYEKDMPFAILHTGGTTGIPKSVLLSHDNLNSLAYQVMHSLYNIEKGEVVLNLMPPFASYGLGNGLHVHLSASTKIILIPDYDYSKIADQLLEYRPNRIACTPAHYEFIKNSEKLRNADLSFLKHPICGGDTLNIKTEMEINELLQKNGCKDNVSKGYGLTETIAMICGCLNNDTNKLLSVGIPLVKNTFGIFDLDDHNKMLPYNTEGEIAVLSPNNMLGYKKMPEETAKMLIKHDDGKVWLHTGDFGKIDEDGLVFISGRMRRMIIQFNGLKSNPFEVEEQILKHPKVKNVVVIGADDLDHEQGKLPVAFILVDTKDLGNSEQLMQELHAMCEANVTYYSIPVDYVFVDELPVTTRGKIDFEKVIRIYKNMSSNRTIIRQRELKFD